MVCCNNVLVSCNNVMDVIYCCFLFAVLLFAALLFSVLLTVGVECWGRKGEQLSVEENWEENKFGKEREENRGIKPERNDRRGRKREEAPGFEMANSITQI